jgi:hypothetical protein
MGKPGLAEHNQNIRRAVRAVALKALDDGYPMPGATAIARTGIARDSGWSVDGVQKALDALTEDGTIYIGPGRRVLEVQV